MDAIVVNNFGIEFLPQNNTEGAESRQVLTNINWQVPKGAFALLTGNTGSGKTTLLKSCVPELAPRGAGVKTQGSLQVNGRVGYVAQNPQAQIVCDSVRRELAFGPENACMPPAQMRRRIAEVATFLGIDSWINRRTSELSGGQKQILALAGTLALEPDILLLDEPTAQLDPIAEQRFIDMLARVWRASGITVVVATHAPDEFAHLATQKLKLAPNHAPQPYADSANQHKHAPHGQQTNKPACGMKNVFFTYSRQDPWVLSGATINFAEGAVHALVGGNGSGKSTALKLLAGVLKPHRGRVMRESAQAYLPQSVEALFVCETAREELMEWAPTASYCEQDALQAAEQFGVSHVLDQHPFDLSGGEQRLLAIAKLSLLRPRLLLADEPTCGLDAPSRAAVAHAFEALTSCGSTVVFATHDLDFAAQTSTDVTMLFDGEAAAAEEPTAEFFANNLFYRPATQYAQGK